eukprot:12930838-Prorocentrum_lima.AAC.1
MFRWPLGWPPPGTTRSTVASGLGGSTQSQGPLPPWSSQPAVLPQTPLCLLAESSEVTQQPL